MHVATAVDVSQRDRDASDQITQHHHTCLTYTPSQPLDDATHFVREYSHRDARLLALRAAYWSLVHAHTHSITRVLYVQTRENVSFTNDCTRLVYINAHAMRRQRLRSDVRLGICPKWVCGVFFFVS